MIDHKDLINGALGGFNSLIGLRFTKATEQEVELELPVTEAHDQPYGLVHGGVYCSLVETLCSVGAALVAMPRGQTTVGVENHTTFLRAVRGGKLRAVGRPLSTGKRSQVWDASIYDEANELVATGRVRLICLEGGAKLAGATVAMKVPSKPKEDKAPKGDK